MFTDYKGSESKTCLHLEREQLQQFESASLSCIKLAVLFFLIQAHSIEQFQEEKQHPLPDDKARKSFGN